jgi:hypothetical protein
MVRRMPYVQQWKGSYRFRRRVPDHLKPIIGKPEWVAALSTKDKAEANRLVVPHIGRTDQIIRDAERGDYPPLPNDRIEPIACDWWRWFCQERAKLLNVGAGLVSNGLDPHLWALTGEKELTDLLARFVAENSLDYRPGSGLFDRIKQRCKEIHHETAYGYRSEIDDRGPLRTKFGMRQTINSQRSRMAVHWKGVRPRRSIDRPIRHPSAPPTGSQPSLPNGRESVRLRTRPNMDSRKLLPS